MPRRRRGRPSFVKESVTRTSTSNVRPDSNLKLKSKAERSPSRSRSQSASQSRSRSQSASRSRSRSRSQSASRSRSRSRSQSASRPKSTSRSTSRSRSRSRGPQYNKMGEQTYRSGFNMFVSRHFDLREHIGRTSAERYDVIGREWRHLSGHDKNKWNHAAKNNPTAPIEHFESLFHKHPMEVHEGFEPWGSEEDEEEEAEAEEVTKGTKNRKTLRERRSTSKRLSGELYTDRPITGYQLFFRHHYNLEDFKGVVRKDRIHEIGHEWTDLPDEDKLWWKKRAIKNPDNVRLVEIEDIARKHPAEAKYVYDPTGKYGRLKTPGKSH